MRLELNLRVAQTVSPQMILSMNMLQYSTQELEEYLEELSYENPLVELKEQPQEQQTRELMDRLQWLKNGDRQNQAYYAQGEDWRSEPAAGKQESLKEYVKEQILTLELTRAERRAMEVAAELLNPRGFFDGTAAEIARLANCDEAVAVEAVTRLKTLSPIGVGAKNVQECLLIQLRTMEQRNAVAEALVEQAFSHLASWPDQRLAVLIGATRQQVSEARRSIAVLNPYPGDGFGSEENTLYIRPDLYVEQQEGEMVVRTCDGAVPQIAVNDQYLSMLQLESDPEVQNYLKKKMGELEQVLRSLHNRKSTILRCGEIIVGWQAEFFQGGALKKMTLADVAAEMGVHESTVSRTVRNKYIQCSRGLFEMASFFSRDAGQNVGMSRETIKSKIMSLIAEENPEKPLSDEKIVEKLEASQIMISRRTVAKYRMELGLLSASGRKTQNSVRKSNTTGNRTRREEEPQ